MICTRGLVFFSLIRSLRPALFYRWPGAHYWLLIFAAITAACVWTNCQNISRAINLLAQVCFTKFFNFFSIVYTFFSCFVCVCHLFASLSLVLFPFLACDIHFYICDFCHICLFTFVIFFFHSEDFFVHSLTISVCFTCMSFIFGAYDFKYDFPICSISMLNEWWHFFSHHFDFIVACCMLLFYTFCCCCVSSAVFTHLPMIKCVLLLLLLLLLFFVQNFRNELHCGIWFRRVYL